MMVKNKKSRFRRGKQSGSQKSVTGTEPTASIYSLWILHFCFPTLVSDFNTKNKQSCHWRPRFSDALPHGGPFITHVKEEPVELIPRVKSRLKKCPKTLKPLVLVNVWKLIPPKLIPSASNQLFMVEEPLMLITSVMHRLWRDEPTVEQLGEVWINDNKQNPRKVHFGLFPAAPTAPFISRNHIGWFAARQKHPLQGGGEKRRRSVKAERDGGGAAGSQFSHRPPATKRSALLPETLRSCWSNFLNTLLRRRCRHVGSAGLCLGKVKINATEWKDSAWPNRAMYACRLPQSGSHCDVLCFLWCVCICVKSTAINWKWK